MGEEWLKIQKLMGQMAHRLTGALAAYVRGSMDAACALETPDRQGRRPCSLTHTARLAPEP